jgi:hypothetical protein
MDKQLLRIIFFASFVFFCVNHACGQSSKTLLAPMERSSYIETVFNKSLQPQSRLYNGVEYQFYNPNIEGRAFFNEANVFEQGDIIYDKILFKDVQLMYDLNTDQVISMLYDGFTKFRLIDEKVSSFELDGHKFIRIPKDSANGTLPKESGFYDKIYSGKVSVLVKRTKVLRETSGTKDLKKYFLTRNLYFLKKDGSYFNVNSHKAFLNAFPTRKKDLQLFLKSQKVKYKSNPERAMIMLAAYYDGISN